MAYQWKEFELDDGRVLTVTITNTDVIMELFDSSNITKKELVNLSAQEWADWIANDRQFE